MEAFNHESSTIEMSVEEESSLWQQRFFEAQAGMERYLTEGYGKEEIARWLPVKSEILKDLENAAPELGDVKFWKERFFRTQARLEKYVAEHHGLEDLERWANAIAQIYKFTEPNRGNGAGDIAFRFARQAHCYKSNYQIRRSGQDLSQVVLDHCAIWDYRELARSNGVQLTLKSPCTYCTKATTANAKAKGYDASFELHDDERGHGCTWEFKRESRKPA